MRIPLVPFLTLTLTLTLSSGCREAVENMVDKAIEESLGDCTDGLVLTEAALEGREDAYEDLESGDDWCESQPITGVSQDEECRDRAYNAAYKNTWLDLCHGDTAAP